MKLTIDISKANAFASPLVTPSGQFHLTREIGRGAEGTVYQASCSSSCGRRAAVKVINNDRNACSENYLQILQLVQHPNILRVVDMEEDHRFTYIITELCDKDLMTLLSSTTAGCFTEHMAVELFKQLCRAVLSLHGAGVVHQDIKLENLLMKNGQLKLGDLGSARFMQPLQSKTGPIPVRDGRTLAYLCPEILARYPNEPRPLYDGRQADIWAMGITLFAMVSGCFPWEEASLHDDNFAIYASSGSLRTFLPETVSASLLNLLQELLCIDPLRRIDSFHVLEHLCFSSLIPETLKPVQGNSKEQRNESCGTKRNSSELQENLNGKRLCSNDIQGSC